MTVTTSDPSSVRPPRPGRPDRFTARGLALLLVLCGALFLEGIDIAMLNVAVPDISADLGISTGAAHWTISAYVLGYAGFMLLGGRSADLFGRRRVFLTALTVFVLFSGLGGLADSATLLVAARFATGVAAGFMTPAGLSIITTSFARGPLRDRAVVVYGATGAAGFVLGTVAGGLLTTLSWRWVFFAPVILGALLLVAGWALIRPDEPRATSSGRRFDLPGAVTVTGAMVASVYGLVSLGEGTHLARALVALVVAAVLLAVFVRVERRSPAPLVRLAVLRHAGLVRANLAGLLYMAAFFGFQFVLTLYLQDLRGWTPLETGLAFAVMGVDLVLAPLLTPRLVARFGNVAVAAAGVVSAVVALALFLRLDDDWGYPQMLPMLVLVGVAFALVYGPLTLAATESVDESEQGLASGLLYTGFQFGGALGLALVTIVLAHGPDPDLVTYRAALVIPLGLALGALAVTLTGVRRRPAASR